MLEDVVIPSLLHQWRPPDKMDKPVKKCRYADKYKALRRPTCGCDTCENKWMMSVTRRDRINKAIKRGWIFDVDQ